MRGLQPALRHYTPSECSKLKLLSGFDEDSNVLDTLICQLNMPIYLTLFFYTQAILHFVNQNMLTMGLQVTDMDKQVKKN